MKLIYVYREQYADQYKLWQENNAYNDPAAQMQRFFVMPVKSCFDDAEWWCRNCFAASVPSAAPMQAGQVTLFHLLLMLLILLILSMLGSGLNQATQARGNQISNTFMSRIKQQELAQSIAQTELLKQQTKKGTMEYSLLESQLTMQKLSIVCSLKLTINKRNRVFQLSNDLTSANASLARQQEKSARAQELFTNVQTKLAGIDLKYKETNMQLAIKQYIQEIALLGSQYRVNETAKNIWQKTY